MRRSRQQAAWATLALASLFAATAGINAVAETPPETAATAADLPRSNTPRSVADLPSDAQPADVLKAIREEMAAGRAALAKEQDRQAQISADLDKSGFQLTEQRARIRAKENAVSQARHDFESHSRQALESDEIRLDNELADYRRLAKELADMRQALQPIEAESQRLNAELSKSKRASLDLNSNLDALASREKQVLVRLAFASLRQHSSIEYGASVKCMETMTLRDCTELSKKNALQEGVGAFRLQTLKSLVAKLGSNRDPATLPLEIEVAGYEVVKQEFQGASTHHTRHKIELSSKPDEKLACQLVGVGADGCSSLFSHPEKPEPRKVAAEPDAGEAGRWAPLTVRSNVYDDEVFINNTAYGPTPLTINLRPGEYRVEVRKSGYQTATASVPLNRARAVVLELKEPKR